MTGEGVWGVPVVVVTSGRDTRPHYYRRTGHWSVGWTGPGTPMSYPRTRTRYPSHRWHTRTCPTTNVYVSDSCHR